MKYYIGIDLGGTNVRTLLVDENGQSYSEVKDATEREKGPDAVTAKICRQIEAIDYTVCGGIENVEGIGIGVPGPVDVVNVLTSLFMLKLRVLPILSETNIQQVTAIMTAVHAIINFFICISCNLKRLIFFR